MEISQLFKDNEFAKDEYQKLQGYFYGWKDLIKYYLSFVCSKQGKKLFNKFQSININYNSSYSVIGNKDILRAFAAYYLRTMGTNRRGFVKHDLKEYAFQYDSNQEFAEDDVLFLISPKYDSYYGNTLRTLEANIMYAVCRRIENNQVTILLMETPIEEFTNKEELTVINLNSILGVKNTSKEILSGSKEDNITNYVEQLLSKYPDLGKVQDSEITAYKKYLVRGELDEVYKFIKSSRKL